MPKVDIDYSNTIFYKIFCKDSTIKDLYVGLTTNFVQRKHAHKQSCKNEKALNHNCKLYSAIRKAGGWDNWQMEIIAFHNCADSYEARKKEQCYFEMLGATLNSIDPFPKPKIKEHPAKIIKEKNILFCEPCKVHFSYWKEQETHNNTKKHHKMTLSQETDDVTPKNAGNFYCDVCDYSCCKRGDWTRHITRPRHVKLANMTQQDTENDAKDINTLNQYMCNCGNTYKHHSGLWRHKKKCGAGEKISIDTPEIPKSYEINEFKEFMSTLTHVTKANAGSSSVVNKFICECGKSYKHRQSLFSHRKQCNIAENEELIGVTPKLTEIQELKESMKCLIKENIVLKNMMIDVIKNGTCKK